MHIMVVVPDDDKAMMECDIPKSFHDLRGDQFTKRQKAGLMVSYSRVDRDVVINEKDIPPLSGWHVLCVSSEYRPKGIYNLRVDPEDLGKILSQAHSFTMEWESRGWFKRLSGGKLFPLSD